MNPSGPWTTQQARNLLMHLQRTLRFVIHDGGGQYTRAFGRTNPAPPHPRRTHQRVPHRSLTTAITAEPSGTLDSTRPTTKLPLQPRAPMRSRTPSRRNSGTFRRRSPLPRPHARRPPSRQPPGRQGRLKRTRRTNRNYRLERHPPTRHHQARHPAGPRRIRLLTFIDKPRPDGRAIRHFR